MAALLRLCYTLCFYVLIPLIFFRLWQRGKTNPGYRHHWAERFGRTPFRLSDSIWLHSVSLGETIAAMPLMKHLVATYPDTPILITTATPSGRAQIQKAFGDQVYCCYFPYDLPHAISRFLRRVRPTVLINMETELWPNALQQCQNLDIPVLLANARLSERSAQGYLRFPSLSRQMMTQLTQIAAQNENDAARFVRVGAPADRVVATGNIKFDLTVPENLAALSEPLRAQWVDRPVWIAASTHEGEEQQVLAAHQQVLADYPNALLILVPRHPERFDATANLLVQQGFNAVRRSHGDPCTAECSVFLGDTMGEMMCFYVASQVAFVGGSLVPIGGHNLLEPAALKLPSLTGPHVDNFMEITQLLVNAGATRPIKDADDLADAVKALFADPALQSKMGQAGADIVERNRGAKVRLLAVMDAFIAPKMVSKKFLPSAKPLLKAFFSMLP